MSVHKTELLDHFAGLAMIELLKLNNMPSQFVPGASYRLASNMLVEREKFIQENELTDLPSGGAK